MKPTITKIPLRYRGTFCTQQMNTLRNQIVHDIHKLYKETINNKSELVNSIDSCTALQDNTVNVLRSLGGL